ncbi:unnamed protein product [Strongylus vulgaris]|uniref:Uncharacterized protein n=1 Tax=Strongylus vulgaris TaxID=40348 RepID=A0A3P7J0I3_STRVU|nr:unnamed protein product [Strongylus vulgaris]
MLSESTNNHCEEIPADKPSSAPLQSEVIVISDDSRSDVDKNDNHAPELSPSQNDEVITIYDDSRSGIDTCENDGIIDVIGDDVPPKLQIFSPKEREEV